MASKKGGIIIKQEKTYIHERLKPVYSHFRLCYDQKTTFYNVFTFAFGTRDGGEK